MTLGVEAARHYAAAITLLQGLEARPVDPATLVGMDVPGLVELNEVRPGLLHGVKRASWRRSFNVED